MSDESEAAIERVHAALAAALAGPVGPGPDERLVLGFSGGPDSTALLAGLLALGYGERLRAVHLNHGTRGAASDADAAWCRAFCEARGVDVTVARLAGDFDADPAGPEAAMRQARLDWWLANLAADECLLLGHHADDQVETMLMRLLRGANSSGLAGLRWRRQLAGLTLLRPLLGLRRQELLDYLAACGIDDWRRDASNADPRYLRNALRHQLLPLLRELGNGDAGLVASAQHLLDDANFIENLTESGAMTELLQLEGYPAEQLRALPPAVMVRALRQESTDGQDMGVPRRAAMERITALLAESPLPTLARIDMDGDWVFELRDGLCRLRSRSALEAEAALQDRFAMVDRMWDWRAEPELALDHIGVTLRATVAAPDSAALQARPQAPADDRTYWPLDALPCPLRVRGRRTGDVMLPYGREGETPVRLKKLLSGANLLGRERWRVVVVCGPDGEILWVPGVRRSARFPVGPETGETLALHFRSESLG